MGRRIEGNSYDIGREIAFIGPGDNALNAVACLPIKGDLRVGQIVLRPAGSGDNLSLTLADLGRVCEGILHAAPDIAWNFYTVSAWP
jgi:hypothetical protein